MKDGSDHPHATCSEEAGDGQRLDPNNGSRGKNEEARQAKDVHAAA